MRSKHFFEGLSIVLPFKGGIQPKRLVVSVALVTGVPLAPAGGIAAAEAAGKLFYGTRIGQTLTIVRRRESDRPMP